MGRGIAYEVVEVTEVLVIMVVEVVGDVVGFEVVGLLVIVVHVKDCVPKLVRVTTLVTKRVEVVVTPTVVGLVTVAVLVNEEVLMTVVDD